MYNSTDPLESQVTTLGRILHKKDDMYTTHATSSKFTHFTHFAWVVEKRNKRLLLGGDPLSAGLCTY